MSYRPRGAGVFARTSVSSLNLLGVSAVALLCAMPLPAVAQQLTEAQSIIVKRITVVAQRSSKSVLDVPQTVSVIDAETLAKHQVRDIQDLVRYEPGITVGRQTALTNPFGQLTSFTIRGVGGNRVQMLVDGSRIQELTTDGSRDFLDPWNMKAVELVRGPNSVLWGADALGGTVAMRTRDPSDLLDGTDKPWAVEIKTGWDSFDNSFRKQITGAYDFGDVKVLASFGHLSANEAKLTKADRYGGIWGCPVARLAFIGCDELFPADTSAYNGLLKGVWTPNADHKVTAAAELFSRNTEIDQIWDSGAGSIYASNSYIRNLDMTRTRLALEHEWNVGAEWLDTVKWNLSYSPQRRVMDSKQRRIYPARVQDNHQIRDYGETFLEGDVQLTSSFALGETEHTLTYGFDGDITHSNYEGVNYVVRSDNVIVPPAINQGFNFPEVETVRADVYIQDEIKLLDERLTITPGVRFATYSIDPTADPDYVPLPGFEPEKMESTRLIKKLSALYKLDDSYSVYAAYGEGFKMPTSQQLFVSASDPFNPGSDVVPNPNLKPESVVNYEAGVRGEFERGYFSVGGFYSSYDNFIRSLQPVPGQPGKFTYDNVDTVNLWGIEASAELEVVDDLFINGSLTWSRGVQQLGGAAETPFDGAVPLTLVTGLRYEMPDNGLEFEVIGTFGAGPTERSNPDAFKPKGYAVFDAYAKWTPAENIELTAGIQNIFDVRYFPNTLAGSNYTNTPSSPAVAGQDPLELQTAPGRTFKLGATVKF